MNIIVLFFIFVKESSIRIVYIQHKYVNIKVNLVLRITNLNIKHSVPLKTVYSNITISGLLSFKL